MRSSSSLSSDLWPGALLLSMEGSIWNPQPGPGCSELLAPSKASVQADTSKTHAHADTHTQYHTHSLLRTHAHALLRYHTHTQTLFCTVKIPNFYTNKKNFIPISQLRKPQKQPEQNWKRFIESAGMGNTLETENGGNSLMTGYPWVPTYRDKKSPFQKVTCPFLHNKDRVLLSDARCVYALSSST